MGSHFAPVSFPNTRHYANYFIILEYLGKYLHFHLSTLFKLQLPQDQQAIASLIIISIHITQHLPWLRQAPVLAFQERGSFALLQILEPIQGAETR